MRKVLIYIWLYCAVYCVTIAFGAIDGAMANELESADYADVKDMGRSKMQ